MLAAADGVVAFPKPAAAPQRWELEFEPGALRLYEDPVGGKAYWYFTYMVTNRTGRQQVWAPSFTLYTDAGEILASGRGVPGRVSADIMDLLGNELLENQNEVIGEIHYGRENAKEGLVVWPARQTAVNAVTMFIAGTSGETATVTNPINGRRVLLRKTLQRDYLIPGDAVARGSKPVDLIDEHWVMR